MQSDVSALVTVIAKEIALICAVAKAWADVSPAVGETFTFDSLKVTVLE
ncbi:hypothetical protein ACFLXV_00690 [Chloroflexota bacterium]